MRKLKKYTYGGLTSDQWFKINQAAGRENPMSQIYMQKAYSDPIKMTGTPLPLYNQEVSNSMNPDFATAAIGLAGTGFLSQLEKQAKNSNPNVRPDGYFQNKGAATGAMTGASLGAKVGSSLGPLGSLAGTFIGATVGGVGGYIKGNKREKEAKRTLAEENALFQKNRELGMQAHHLQNPDFAAGNQYGQMYEYGALSKNYLANQKALGGSMKPLSKNTTEVIGPNHEQGGVELPMQGAEVEGGETTSGDYVFSKALGMAQLHKPIAKALGKIETKPSTPERLNSLRRLKEKENVLMKTQENIKQTFNLQ